MPSRPTLKCADCGGAMWVGTGAKTDGTGRCRPCRRDYPMVHDFTCARCGIDFTSRSPNRVYCSASCSGYAWSGKVNPKRARREGARAPRGGDRYMKARAALKARGDAYCWRGCGTWLLVDVPQGHPQFMTLGHVIAWDDDPSLFWQPDNHMPECGPCNFRDGARRTNSKRHPNNTPQGVYRNPDWVQASAIL